MKIHADEFIAGGAIAIMLGVVLLTHASPTADPYMYAILITCLVLQLLAWFQDWRKQRRQRRGWTLEQIIASSGDFKRCSKSWDCLEPEGHEPPCIYVKETD